MYPTLTRPLTTQYPIPISHNTYSHTRPIMLPVSPTRPLALYWFTDPLLLKS